MDRRRPRHRRDKRHQREDRFRPHSNRNRKPYHKTSHRRFDSPPKSPKYRFDSPPRSFIEYSNSMWNHLNAKATEPEQFMEQIQQVSATIPSTHASKIDRQLYVGNLPTGITQDRLIDLLNSTLANLEGSKSVSITQAGSPVIGVCMSNDGTYAFIEFRSVEEAKAGYHLNDVSILGQKLRVGRPHSFGCSEPAALPAATAVTPNSLGLTKVSDEMAGRLLGGSGKLILSGLPHGFDPEDVEGFLKGYGELQTFEMPKDLLTGMTKGYALFDLVDESANNTLLNPSANLMCGKYKVTVAKVGKDSLQTAFKRPIPADSRAMFKSRILVLKNMVCITDLENEDDYQELHEDVMEECKAFGSVLSIVVPRPGANTSGIGNIFVEFASIDEAQKAHKNLAGVEFQGRNVETGFHPEELFFQSNFTGD